MANQSNQNILILALIVVLGFAMGYFYYSGWAVPARVPVEPPPVSERDNLKMFENMKIDFSILDNKKYKALDIFGESPVNPGSTGKKDIFAPI